MAVSTGAAILGAGVLGAGMGLYGAGEQADAAEAAAATQAAASRYSADLEQQRYEQTREDQMPWLQSGARALTELEQMMGQAPTFADYQQSDYSKFIQEQGLKEIEAKGRAGGYYHTGATSKDMMQYAQDMAGQDYQQYLGNYYQSLNPYMQMAGLGQQQSQLMGQMGAQSAAQQGLYATQGAQAQAAGQIGAANAYAGGLQNVSDMAMMGAMLYQGGK